MNFTSESVMHDIEVALRERSEEEWSNTDQVLVKAQLHIASLQRQLDHKELTDEEKWKLWGECPHGLVYDRVMMFADLVLRKAQE